MLVCLSAVRRVQTLPDSGAELFTSCALTGCRPGDGLEPDEDSMGQGGLPTTCSSIGLAGLGRFEWQVDPRDTVQTRRRKRTKPLHSESRAVWLAMSATVVVGPSGRVTSSLKRTIHAPISASFIDGANHTGRGLPGTASQRESICCCSAAAFSYGPAATTVVMMQNIRFVGNLTMASETCSS